ncbi:hypothetical protein M2273_005358 [Mucilaginibacter lappiensis]
MSLAAFTSSRITVKANILSLFMATIPDKAKFRRSGEAFGG